MRQSFSSTLLLAVVLGLPSMGAPQTPAPAAGQSPASTDRLLLLNTDQLHDARRRISADADSSGAGLHLAQFLLEAQKAAGTKAVSVMEKTITPPSGDKHDYMSQAPYWWPDPTKPDGRPYVRQDGKRNPEINRLSDHDNLGRICNAVATLGLAYWFKGQVDYAEHAAHLTRVWFLDPATRMNPHLKFGQGIPGVTEGRGIGIIETRCLPDLLDGIILISGSKAWTPQDEAGLQSWMRAYLDWLINSPHGQAESKNGNNHETWYDVQVASLALYTGQRDLARQTVEGARARIDRQFEPDGRQPRELERTRSWDYSEFNLTAFFNLATLGERVGVDLWTYRSADGRSLRRGLEFLVPFAAGDRKWTFDQITEFRPSTLANVLRRGAKAWNEPQFRALADKIGGANPRIRLLWN